MVLVVLAVCRSVSVGCCASPVTGPRFGCLRRFSIFFLCGTLSLKLRGLFSSGSDVYARVVLRGLRADWAGGALPRLSSQERNFPELIVQHLLSFCRLVGAGACRWLEICCCLLELGEQEMRSPAERAWERCSTCQQGRKASSATPP